MTRKIFRILVAKPGLDGHDRGARAVVLGLRDAGMEVIYTGLHWTPEMIVKAALQENVDAIGLSILSGAHMTIFPKMQRLLKENDMNDVLLFGGGVIPPDDVRELKVMGIGGIFPPGTSIKKIVDYLQAALAAGRN